MRILFVVFLFCGSCFAQDNLLKLAPSDPNWEPYHNPDAQMDRLYQSETYTLLLKAQLQWAMRRSYDWEKKVELYARLQVLNRDWINIVNGLLKSRNQRQFLVPEIKPYKGG